MRNHPFVRLELAVFVVGLLVVVLTASGCAGADALQPAVAGAAQQPLPSATGQTSPPPPTAATDRLTTPADQAAQPVATAQTLPLITPTGTVVHLVPPIPLASGHNYDGGVYVTQADAEAALGHPIRLPLHLPDGVTLKYVELEPNLPAVALHFSDGIMVSVDPAPAARDYHQWALGEAEAGRGMDQVLTINGVSALGRNPGVVATDLGNQAILGTIAWVDDNLSYVMYTSTWPLEKMIPIAETMIGQPVN